MDALVRVPHGFLRRNLSRVERGLVAAGLGLLLYRLFTTLPAYPSPWEVVAATAVFFVVLWSPPLGYFLAVTTALYPLYTLSLYLAVLFLAISLLGQRVFIHNLGATLLVLLAPWLAQYHLEWIVVLLGGLWWGKTGGAWIGGLAALWGLVLFGMAGQSSNWLDMMGIAPASAGLFAQFQDANSLETLKRIVAPLAPNPTQTLYHLLQIVVWAMAAGLVGGLSETTWVQQKHPWRAISIAVFGAAGLAAVNIGLASWLEQYKTADFAWIVPGMLESALYAAVTVAVLEGARDLIEHPLGLRRPRSAPAQDAQVHQAPVPLLRRLLPRLQGLRVLRKPTVLAHSAEPPDGPLARSTAQTAAPYQPVPVPKNLPHRDGNSHPPDASYHPPDANKHPPDVNYHPPDDIIQIELD